MDKMIDGGCRLLLNGVWEFVEGPDEKPPTVGWQTVRIPHRSREFEEAPPSSGWYRTQLTIPATWTVIDQRFILELERVRHFGRVYLDGKILDEHYHMRLPWRLDLSALVQPGASYELLVYTHNCTGAYAHRDMESLSVAAEKALDTLFWHTSIATVGIEGDVWLCLEPLVRLVDPYIVTSVRERTIAVQVTVCNQSHTAFAGQIDWYVSGQGQKQLDLPAVPVQLEAGATKIIRIEVPWATAVLWGRPPYGEPILYCLHAALLKDKPVHQLVERFGFREVWADGDKLLLNGKKLMPWGDHTVPYVYERQWLTRKLHDWAKANISILEHHRYDAPEVFYDVADELGAFVVGANFCVGTGQVPPADLDPQEMQLIMDSHLAVADAWIRRTRNHPAILFWDITDAREPSFCVPLLRQVKKLDPTRIAEVTFDPLVATDELVKLIDCYRLFSSLEHIEASIEQIRSDPALPCKPIRVGEAGIFTNGSWGAATEPPLAPGWEEFLKRIPERNIHGLQTFFLADMDYRVFETSVPGSLVAPVFPDIKWPSASGRDARIDPFGVGTQEAWGKATLYVNWCDPKEPVSRPTQTYQWSQALYRHWTGSDVGGLEAVRVPEIIVYVEQGELPVGGAQVFVEALAGQGITPFGIQADAMGSSWFVLPESGAYRFSCAGVKVDIVAHNAPVEAPAGYEHIQHVRLALPIT